jgi:hypothetical protein
MIVNSITYKPLHASRLPGLNAELLYYAVASSVVPWRLCKIPVISTGKPESVINEKSV